MNHERVNTESMDSTLKNVQRKECLIVCLGLSIEIQEVNVALTVNPGRILLVCLINGNYRIG